MGGASGEVGSAAGGFFWQASEAVARELRRRRVERRKGRSRLRGATDSEMLVMLGPADGVRPWPIRGLTTAVAGRICAGPCTQRMRAVCTAVDRSRGSRWTPGRRACGTRLWEAPV